jgi:YVTN family beta-propeller protein
MSTRLEFQILGPLETRANGTSIGLGGPRQRALLAVLLMHANRVVSRDRLIDELLTDQPAATADRTLRVQISRLRACLATADPEPRVMRRSPGYLLRVEPDELDLHRFERLLTEGRQALEDDDPARAAVMLRKADSLWRGRPLADLEFEPFARMEVERLEELRLAALEERTEAELILGRHGTLVSELEVLVAEHPLRERLRGQLMLALYRSGRQAEALEAYRIGRAHLAGELALEPNPRLRELEQAILRQDETLELDQRHQRVGTVVLERPGSGTGSGSTGAGTRRHGLRPRVLVAGLGLTIAGIAAAIVTPLETGGSAAPPPIDSNAVALVSPRSGSLRATVPLQAAPTDVAAGFGSLWISEIGADRLVRVDSRRHAIQDTVAVGRGPTAVATGAGDVWVVNTLDDTLARIDPTSDSVAQTITVGTEPSAVVVDAGTVWVANHGDGTVSRVDPRTGRLLEIIRTGGGPNSLATSDGTVWVANDQSGTVTRLDARTGTVTDTIHVGDAPSALAVSTKAVWVLDRLDSTVSRIDPTRDVVDSTVAIPGAPVGLVVAHGSVWVADAAGALHRLDSGRGSLAETVAFGGQPQAFAEADGLWVAVDAGGTQHRGGTLVVVGQNGAINTLDPGTSNSWNDVPQVLGLTNDGLVSLDHVSGPQGARLVPDLSLSLPKASEGGRVYTFRLRRDIRYSTGALVRPRDVRRSFERLFELGSSGADLYRAITGSQACTRSERGTSCDLSQGIVIDDRANTVAFHLTHPDPDFLYKLTVPYADVLPASMSSREAPWGVPATGPYRIASYNPASALLLVRNQRFREWSRAAQPAGYPDRILVRLGLSGARGAALVDVGKADLMNAVGMITGDRESFLIHHPGQVHINPQLNTGFLFLNVTAPPFNDGRVRRALNFALDRGQIATADGGAIAATPTC